MYSTEILTIEDFVETSKEWDANNFLDKLERLKNHLKQDCYNLRRSDFGFDTFHPYNNEIGNLIDQLRTLDFRLRQNIYQKPRSETWEQYLINREIIRRFFPDFECPSWQNGPFSDWD